MSILIVGANGSMGKRYQAILSHLGREFQCVDVFNSESLARYAYEAEGIILATPTNTHLDMINTLFRLNKPILCEKPIDKNIAKVRQMIGYLRNSNTPFQMMSQYRELVPVKTKGDTEYNFFRHGSDGLVWDCIQIISLALGKISLKEDSPVWRCKINGIRLNPADMDQAYVTFVEKWLRNPKGDLGQILDAHEKTAKFEREFKNGTAQK